MKFIFEGKTSHILKDNAYELVSIQIFIEFQLFYNKYILPMELFP